jgi:YD repeat-containing protein
VARWCRHSANSWGSAQNLAGNVVAAVRSLRKLVVCLVVCGLLSVAALFAGPVMSGAVLLLLPAPRATAARDLPDSYEPIHKGHVSLDTGLYVRENEDLVVPGNPALILRRTYLATYRVSKEFGVGTTHNGERYLIGDGERFQWAKLIRNGSNHISFKRISSGTSVFNAMFEHGGTPDEWDGARLGWTGLGWALRRRDGSLSLFRPCGPQTTETCSVVQDRDPEGRVIDYRRNASGRLYRMEAGKDRWIAIDYDAQNRIVRAHDSTARVVRYDYDERGRLWRAASSSGEEYRYTYTDRDEMATIAEPGTTIENGYDENGRCVRPVNRYPDAEPYIFDFTYRTDGPRVVQADSHRSDGTWSRYTFDTNGYTTSETWGSMGSGPATFTYERDPTTNLVIALTLTCPDRTGRPLRRSSLVKPGREEWLKWDLVRTYCAWTGQSWRTTE